MAVDVNLILQQGESVTASTDTTGIPVEGGFFAEFRAWFAAMTGTNPTDDITVQYSPDNQVTWYEATKFPQIVGTNDNAEIARVGYIPVSNAPATYPTYIRLHHVVTGTTPVFVVTLIAAKPLTSLAIPDVDIKNSIGFCNGIAAT